MKVCMISGYDPTGSKLGGAEISSYILAKALVSLGIEVHLITGPPSNNKKKVEVLDGIHIHRVLYGLHRLTFFGGGIFSVILSSRTIVNNIRKIHQKENFDLIHSCNRNVAVGVIMASREIGIPHIIHIRDYWPVCPTTSFQRYYTDRKCKGLSHYCIFCHFTDFKHRYGSIYALFWSIYAYFQTIIRKAYAMKDSNILAISEFVKSILVSNGFDSKKIMVVANPMGLIDQPKCEDTFRSKKIVLFVGRLSVYKGVFDAVKAVEAVHKNFVNVELRIIGGDPSEETLRRWVKNKKMPFVKILGWLSHTKVLKEYSKADIVVLPFKRPEPFGRVIIEAMAAGKPVVTYSVGDVMEIIKDGETGILVEEGKIDDLANSIANLLENEKLRKEMGEKARSIAEIKYDPKRIAKTVLQIYEKIMD